MSRSGYGDTEISGDVRQQSHHDELARTDGEAAEGKSQYRPSESTLRSWDRYQGPLRRR
jgi:hypothetical protein